MNLHLRRQRLTLDEGGHRVWRTVTEEAAWPTAATALLLCDVWDSHWCRGARERMEPLVPRMNQTVTVARAAGVQIVHAPSGTMEFYAEHPARLRALEAEPADPAEELPAAAQDPDSLVGQLFAPGGEAAEYDPPLPVDAADNGTTVAENDSYKAWKSQHPGIDIDPERDLISDDGRLVYACLQARGVTRMLILGVHTNMCVLHRSFGIKQMTKGRKLAMGKDAVLLALVGGIICSVGMVSGESKPMDGTVTPHLVVPVAVEGVRVDGDLGAGEWGGASCIDLKVTTSGRAIVPMARTNVCVQFDSTYFYVSFQTPYRVEGQVKRAGIARDDEQIALSSDDVEVFLEPEASGSGPFFQICVNADNLVYDRWWPSEQAVEQIRRDGTPSDETLVEMAFLDGVRWDAKGLLTGVGRMRESWVVEMAIPFSDLFVAGAPRGEIWRGNFAAHSFWPEFSDWSTWADTGPLLFAPATFLGIRFTE